MKKTILKTGYYYEFKDIYDSLPDELPVPTDYIEIENKEVRTEQQMIDGQELLSKEEAFGLICKIITDNNIEKYKSKIVFFKDKDGLCKVCLCLDNDGWDVYTNTLYASHKWNADNRSFFHNTSNTFTFDQAVKIVKDAGYKITREKTIIEEL